MSRVISEKTISWKCISPETWILFLALNNIHFLLVFGKSLRNNAPPMILSNTPPWYFQQYHQRYSLWCVARASTPCWHSACVTDAGMSPALAHHPLPWARHPPIIHKIFETNCSFHVKQRTTGKNSIYFLISCCLKSFGNSWGNSYISVYY